jgi:uncharacterized protein
MIEFLFTFVIFLLVVASMAVGVMRGRKPIAGSCGGLNSLGVGGACEICGGDMAKCEAVDAPKTRKFYDAA